jgi:protein SCO1/2
VFNDVACAQIVTDRPEGVVDVGIVDQRGDVLPLDTRFVDSTGKAVRLGDYFDGEKPVILSFNYASCPMLCKLQLNGLVEGLRELEATTGEEFRVVSISIDPSETPQQAAVAKQQHLNAYGRPGSGDGWTFLTGEPEQIRSAADAAGFRYKYIRKTGEYSHAAGIMVCTPDGQLSQYLYGVMFEEQTLRLSLADASSGRMGSALDQLLLFCFSYDRSTGKYTPVARNIMRVGALGTILLLAVCVAPFWFRSRNKPAPIVKPLRGITV